jgi:hypothetical protein
MELEDKPCTLYIPADSRHKILDKQPYECIRDENVFPVSWTYGHPNSIGIHFLQLEVLKTITSSTAVQVPQYYQL